MTIYCWSDFWRGSQASWEARALSYIFSRYFLSLLLSIIFMTLCIGFMLIPFSFHMSSCVDIYVTRIYVADLRRDSIFTYFGKRGVTILKQEYVFRWSTRRAPLEKVARKLIASRPPPLEAYRREERHWYRSQTDQRRTSRTHSTDGGSRGNWTGHFRAGNDVVAIGCMQGVCVNAWEKTFSTKEVIMICFMP